jgi:hypothetical protein
MSCNPKDKIVTWVDNGLFVDFALSCAPGFKHTYYWTPWASGFPKSNSLLPGDGFEEMDRVRWVWDAIEKSDIIIFPDVYFGDMQVACEKMGKQVWGARKGELIELNRVASKRILNEHGVDPSPATVVVGIEALREYLKEHEKVWVKISANRGDFETFKNENYHLSEPKLDELEHKLGAKKTLVQFIVEPDISPAVEWGIDAWTVDGQWPSKTYSGCEIKDLGFIGRVMDWTEIPEAYRRPNEKMSDWFREQRYRGWFSTELRITPEKDVFLIDPCARLPSPPNEAMQEVFSNWPEIIAEGAEGNMASPETAHQYAAIAMIHSSWATNNWQAVEFPEEIRKFVKLRNHCKIDGKDFFVPQLYELPEIGAVIGVGDTLDECIEHLRSNAEQVKGYYLEIKLDSIDKALEEIHSAKEIGIEI